jgi:hypothetical protein
MGLHSGPSSVAAATIAPCHCRHRASKSSAHLARHNTSLNCTRGRAPQPTQETSLKELTPLPASFNLPWPFPQTHARAHETTLLLLARCAQCVDEIAPLWRWPEERVVLCGGLRTVAKVGTLPREITQLANFSHFVAAVLSPPCRPGVPVGTSGENDPRI